jgi:CheY-like chemotaxis protein
LGGTLLLIDDDRDIVDSVAEALFDEGYEVSTAFDGDEGLRRLEQADVLPDVILVDAGMQRVSGYEFRDRQLKMPRLAGVPTYLLTAGAVDAGRAKSLTGWLRKPVTLDTLLGVLERHCRPVKPHDHMVHFYERDAELIGRVTSFLAKGLASGEAAAVIATAEHLHAFRAELAATRVDTTGLERDNLLFMADAEETLRGLISGGVPDPRAFEAKLGTMMDRLCAAAPSGRVRAYGEMVTLLWSTGDVATAIQLESLWNEMGQRRQFSLLCGYLTNAGPAKPHGHSEVLRMHSAVI